MGLDMYLYMEKNDYRCELMEDKRCVYPSELKPFAVGLRGRDFLATIATKQYKIGYWRRRWDIHDAIARALRLQSDELVNREIYDTDIPAIIESLESLYESEAEDFKNDAYAESETRFAINVFKDALEFLNAHPYDYHKPNYSLRYHASW